jgi:NADH-quinone oxidoreductase subunit H
MNFPLIIEILVKSLLLIVVMLTAFAYLTWYERKALARLQVRYGPNRAGPRGLLQPVADAIKLIFKEELIPARADKVIFLIAPMLTLIPAIIIMAVVPWGTKITLFGQEYTMGLADINVGILYLMSVTSISVYGLVLAGWSSNNKYSMMGGLRSSAQMVSYELALGLSFVAPILLAGSMSLRDIVEAQRGVWFAVTQPLAAIVFLLSSMAEINRHPFDMPEAEQELTAGYHTEYSGMKFAMFFIAEYMKMIAVSAFAATMFFGGYLGPGVDIFPFLGPIYLGAKVVVLLFILIWIRASLPRFRYDRLMGFGWKVMLPAGLFNVFVTAVATVIGDSIFGVGSPEVLWVVAGVNIATLFLAVAFILSRLRTAIGKAQPQEG